MSRYFFHQVHAGRRIEDHQGSLHSTLDGARNEALTGALEIMVGRLWKGQDPNHSYFEIVDLAGDVVLIVPFQDAIKGHPRESQPAKEIDQQIARRE
jgi:hypothetical protein